MSDKRQTIQLAFEPHGGAAQVYWVTAKELERLKPELEAALPYMAPINREGLADMPQDGAAPSVSFDTADGWHVGVCLATFVAWRYCTIEDALPIRRELDDYVTALNDKHASRPKAGFAIPTPRPDNSRGPLQ